MNGRATGMFLMCTALMLWPCARVSQGEEPSSLRKEKSKLKGLEEDVAKTRKAVKEQRKKEGSIMEQLDAIDRELEKKRRELAIYEFNLAHNRKKEQEIEAQLLKIEKGVAEKLDHLKGRLRAIYKSGGIGLMKVIFSADSVDQLIQSMTLMRYIAQSDARDVAELRRQRELYCTRTRELEEYASSVNSYKEQASRKKGILERQQGERYALLESVRRNKERQIALLNGLERQSKELRRLIERWGAGKAADGDFTALKGKLIWPVEGKVLVPFGLHHDSRLDRKILNNGIDIGAPLGSDILSVGAGKVVYAGWFLGYGKLIIIDHGNGYTTIYAHTSEIAVQEGQPIKGGERIGSVGDTHSLRGAELYFEIRHNGQPRDPLVWLSRR
ncbi:MAG: murein hydrolase activator EnvC family protein [bacterium]